MIKFLTLSEVLQILEDQIRNYGGLYGLRDINLLSSALYMPESSFNRQYIHKTISAMAAACAFHNITVDITTQGIVEIIRESRAGI